MKLRFNPSKKSQRFNIQADKQSTSSFVALINRSKKLFYAGAALMLSLSACKKQYDQADIQLTPEAEASNSLSIAADPSPRIFFMDKGDLFSITNLGVAKPTVTKKFTIGKADVYEHFNNNDNFSSNTLAFNMKTNEIFALGYDINDKGFVPPHLYKSSTIKNSVTDIKTTALNATSINHVRISPIDGKVYYTGSGKVFRMNADGTNSQMIVDKPEIFAEDMDIDFDKGLIYFINFHGWSDKDHVYLYSMDVCGLNGQNHKVIIPSLFGVNATGGQVRLDVKRNKLFYSTKLEIPQIYFLWSISTSGDTKTLKREMDLPYTDKSQPKFVFDIVPSLNKVIWSLHEPLNKESKVGRLNLATGVSDILYKGSDINCVVASNP